MQKAAMVSLLALISGTGCGPLGQLEDLLIPDTSEEETADEPLVILPREQHRQIKMGHGDSPPRTVSGRPDL